LGLDRRLRIVGLPKTIQLPISIRNLVASHVLDTEKQRRTSLLSVAGMGRSNRRRHQQFVRWAVVVGIFASALFAYLLYLLSRNH